MADLNRALHFYVDQLGFTKNWHAGDGAGTVCQVSRSDCEIILCQEPARRDKARLFIELTAEGLRDFRGELAERSVPSKATWWGYDTTQVDDPDVTSCCFPCRTDATSIQGRTYRSGMTIMSRVLPAAAAVLMGALVAWRSL